MAEPGEIPELVDSANICAHCVASVRALGSDATLSCSSRIRLTELASYLLVTTQRYSSRIRACISINEQLFMEREDKTDILFGISVGLRSLHQGVIDHISDRIKRRTRRMIRGCWYAALVRSNW